MKMATTFVNNISTRHAGTTLISIIWQRHARHRHGTMTFLIRFIASYRRAQFHDKRRNFSIQMHSSDEVLWSCSYNVPILVFTNNNDYYYPKKKEKLGTRSHSKYFPISLLLITKHNDSKRLVLIIPSFKINFVGSKQVEMNREAAFHLRRIVESVDRSLDCQRGDWSLQKTGEYPTCLDGVSNSKQLKDLEKLV